MEVEVLVLEVNNSLFERLPWIRGTNVLAAKSTQL